MSRQARVSVVALLVLAAAETATAASQAPISTEWLRSAAPGAVGHRLIAGAHEEIVHVEPVLRAGARRRLRSDATLWPADMPNGAVLYSRAKPTSDYCVSTRYEVTFDEAMRVYNFSRRPAFAIPTRDVAKFRSLSLAAKSAACGSLRGGDIYVGFGDIGLDDKVRALDRAVRSVRTARPSEPSLSCQDESLGAQKSAEACRDVRRSLGDLDLRNLASVDPSDLFPDTSGDGKMRGATPGAQIVVAQFRPDPNGDFWQLFVEWRPGPAGPRPTNVALTRQTTVILTAG